MEDGATFTTALESELITVGRHPESMVPLPSPSVSSHHASIQWREDGFYVQDLGSRNGTRVNGAEIEEARLNDGDRVAFGDVQAVYYDADHAPEPVLAPVAQPPPPPVVIQKLVTEAAPVTGIPHGSGKYNPKMRGKVAPARGSEGGGCGTAIVFLILFLGAFVLGLCIRHYKQTGGFLPTDLSEKVFSKASKIHIETGDK